MIRTIVLTNPGGETLALDLFEPWNTGIAVKNVDGLGPGKADINTTDLALTDSALFNGSRVQKRTISLTLVPMETTTQDVEQSRQKIYRFCQIKQPVRITVYADHRQVYTDGYVESSEPDIWSNLESQSSVLTVIGMTTARMLRTLSISTLRNRHSSSPGRTLSPIRPRWSSRAPCPTRRPW